MQTQHKPAHPQELKQKLYLSSKQSKMRLATCSLACFSGRCIISNIFKSSSHRQALKPWITTPVLILA
jgi:hypothetical protein